jgi:hypothetical protein
VTKANEAGPNANFCLYQYNYVFFTELASSYLSKTEKSIRYSHTANKFNLNLEYVVGLV